MLLLKVVVALDLPLCPPPECDIDRAYFSVHSGTEAEVFTAFEMGVKLAIAKPAGRVQDAIDFIEAGRNLACLNLYSKNAANCSAAALLAGA